MARTKIVLSAGGTGGHIFPAQALADDLLEKGEIEILFAGAGLSTNKYFQKEKYPYVEVASGTPFRRSVGAILKAFLHLLRGVWQSWKLLSREKPDLVVGFGSFHSFPVLLAATLKRIPLFLFESNAIPGKANRLFSRFAEWTAVYFAGAAEYLKGKVVEVEMPVRRKETTLSTADARRHFGLEPDGFTLLVFGGSQGATALNKLLMEMAAQEFPFQVIHLAGNLASAEQVRTAYVAAHVAACVKEFEPRMELAYKAASMAITRSGAATLSELIACEVPAILIPYPFATDDHQKKNAEFVEHSVKGAVHFTEKELSVDKLHREMLDFFHGKSVTLRKSLTDFNSQQKKSDLCTLICNWVKK